MRRINLGCGASLRDGWVNIDMDSRYVPADLSPETAFVQRDVLRGLLACWLLAGLPVALLVGALFGGEVEK